MTAQQDWAEKQLFEPIEDMTGIHTPRHVLARLSALLFPQEVVFVDARFEAQGRNADLWLVLFTEDLVAVLQGNGLNVMAPPSASHQAGNVTVVVLARRALESVEITEGGGPGTVAWNSNPEWQTGTENLTTWPFGGQLMLRYRGRPSPLLLPFSDKAKFEEFVPQLMQDLASD
ncbi:hypothetical protein [Blastococcus sp. PRF04-17]|uniref:hypothetical protein n=1 Tax=Blastococcus sp. PRF04-17 TaxID=2933797 RepID=UPI001FF5C5A2|nr:hypothetical protein [Blastococcus sp. PRF04-17]UOY03624.1 hypothetical protein MVA48_09965 [Blastococcus sp. PRF04-17]